LPPLSSGGTQVPGPWLRFHTPLIEPDVRICRIRLSARTSRLHPRRAAAKLREAYESEVPVRVREWIRPAPASPRFVLASQPPEIAFEKARHTAELALRIDPNLALPRVVLGAVHVVYDWDWAGAERELDQALLLAPRD
jgi:hypothetical protein